VRRTGEDRPPLGRSHPAWSSGRCSSGRTRARAAGRT
jgi:hypothetical protein